MAEAGSGAIGGAGGIGRNAWRRRWASLTHRDVFLLKHDEDSLIAVPGSPMGRCLEMVENLAKRAAVGGLRLRRAA
ncbi:MAG: hypothetical protein ABSF27_07375 [Candidatus Dormibacteria bacterium]